MDVEASSVTAPVPSLPASTASSAPVIVTVTVIVSVALESVSVTVIVKASVTESPASRAVVSASVLSNVYVQSAPLIAREPYVPAAVPIA